MQNLYDVGAFLDAIVDRDWRMHELTNAGTPGDRTANIGEVPQKSDMFENGGAEPLRSRRKVVPGVFEDVLKIG